ncbi:hypothetical protein [Bryobacter aggregatus]|uniref:hypothetical protein n=1 Tax=Bryobacter aggregatus TaxID=360054 RepID=UPI0004E2332D|nr:hypothetical protein [Bryobacter aggregatus]
MNPKILLAFVGGAALAGVLAVFLTGRGETKVPVSPETQASTQAKIVERDVAGSSGNAADIAATMEPVKPRPVEAARRSVTLPKPAPVEVRPGKVAEPVKTAQNDTSNPGVMLPPFSNSNPQPNTPSEGVRNENHPPEILRPDPMATKAARVPETVTIPVGTSIGVRINSTLNSEKNVAGDTFTAVLDTPLVVNDLVLAERGAKVDGKIVELDRSGRVKGVARMTIALTRIQLSDGQKIELRTDPWERMAESSKKSDAVKVGVMTGIGAAIGAIAGGGKGAAIGGASGAGAGTGVVLATRGKAAQIDVETKIPFRLSNAVTVTERIR